MDILDLIINFLLLYFAFKLGEAVAYVRVANSRQLIKDHDDNLLEKKEGILIVEKINNQYYAYINNDFVAQGSTLEEVQRLVKELILRQPSRYSSFKIVLKD
jgi:hypothetical protein